MTASRPRHTPAYPALKARICNFRREVHFPAPECFYCSQFPFDSIIIYLVTYSMTSYIVSTEKHAWCATFDSNYEIQLMHYWIDIYVSDLKWVPNEFMGIVWGWANTVVGVVTALRLDVRTMGRTELMAGTPKTTGPLYQHDLNGMHY